MIQLKILDGQNVFLEISLDPDRVYSVGRGSDCDIVLDAYPGISRSHLELTVEKSNIKASLLSTSGKLIQSGKSISNATLTNKSAPISIPPYDFHFSFPNVESSLTTEEDKKEITPKNKKEPNKKETSSFEEHSNLPSYSNNFDADEKTKTAIASPLEHSLKVFKGDRLLQELALDGTVWNFGRNDNCHYVIKTKKASRNHFSILKLQGKFFVKDLGSSNGTLLNSQQLPINQEIEIKSGDFIEVAEFKFIFEIKDLSYNNKLSSVAIMEKHFTSPDEVDPDELEDLRASALAVSDDFLKLPESKRHSYVNNSAANKKTKLIRYGLASLLLIGSAYFYFAPNNKSLTAAELAAIKEEERLKKERVNAAVDKFNLALRFYNESQFERCVFEIDEFLKFGVETDETAGAQELKTQCDLEREQLQRKKDLEIQEQKRLALEEKIQGFVDTCTPLAQEGTAALNPCIEPVVELDPGNIKIQELIDIATNVDIEREQDAAARKKYLSRVAKGKALFRKAEDYDTHGDWKRALKAYKKHLDSNYPDPKNLKKKSKRSIASINTRTTKTIEEALVKAQEYYDNAEYKLSILAADKGLDVNRDNEKLLTIKGKSDKELTTILRSLYQESILEEEYGQIDEAKIKWKKIEDMGVEGTEYYLKAKNKLKYYEEGL